LRQQGFQKIGHKARGENEPANSIECH